MLLVEKMRSKSPSMRARGVAFAIESIANTGIEDDASYKRLERVVLAKLDEFIPHYTIKVLSSFYKAGQGSGELYDELTNNVIRAMQNQGSVKYSDLLTFFEIYPEISYIYLNTMSEDTYSYFVATVAPLIKDKKVPTKDICRVFNILVRIGPCYGVKLEGEALQAH